MTSQRMKMIASAVFFELAQHKDMLRAAGRRVVDLGIGTPDQPPPPAVLRALAEAIHYPEAFRYPGTDGTRRLRQAACAYMARRFRVNVDPDAELLVLIGAQDGLSHLPLAMADPGDTVIAPDPGYPIYVAAAHLAGATLHALPLRAENHYLPDFSSLPPDVYRRTKIMILNYPNNPTGATAPRGVLEQAVQLARTYGFLLVHDAAYAELVMDGPTAPSLLQIPGGKDVGIELHSLSKMFNFAGARVAFAVGNSSALQALRTLKSNMDYGVFLPVQAAAAVALEEGDAFISSLRDEYRRRRDAFLAPLHNAGWSVAPPQATMFVWAGLPGNASSREFALRLLDEAGVGCVPGSGFGALGEGFVRFALVQPPDILEEAAHSIAAALRDGAILS